jgi:hypothetical protein
MNPNDIKRGARIRLIDGAEATVCDSRRGIIREIETPLLYDPSRLDRGSCYISTWSQVLVDGIWQPVVLSAAHIAACERAIAPFRSSFYAS